MKKNIKKHIAIKKVSHKNSDEAIKEVVWLILILAMFAVLVIVNNGNPLCIR